MPWIHVCKQTHKTGDCIVMYCTKQNQPKCQNVILKPPQKGNVSRICHEKLQIKIGKTEFIMKSE